MELETIIEHGLNVDARLTRSGETLIATCAAVSNGTRIGGRTQVEVHSIVRDHAILILTRDARPFRSASRFS